MWYGVSNIAGRMLTYLLTPYLTYMLTGPKGQLEFGRYSFIYLCLPVMNVLYTYGMETAFFRYSTTEEPRKLYRTQLTAMLLSTLLLTGLLLLFRGPLSVFAEIPSHPEYIGWCAAILGLDALSALPYARLRKENRPRKYALTKVAGILMFVGVIVALFSLGGNAAKSNPNGAFAHWYQHHWGVGFILFANILQAVVTLLLLYKEIGDYKPLLDKKLLGNVLTYGFPILIAGFAGTINDSLNRVMFTKLYPDTSENSLRLMGVYSAAVRLSVMISLVIQAFRMSAEPFFFSISKEKNAPDTYARVMKWFVVVLTLMFLNVTLYIDIWKYFVGPQYRNALGLVPVLLLSNIFLGIYYNLTVWYKLTDRTQYGAYIMLAGAFVTVVFNWIFIPKWGYAACAWGTLLCYTVMMILSYILGQKYYPVPYETPKMMKYLVVMLAFYLIQTGVIYLLEPMWIHLLTGTFLFSLYLVYIMLQERQELKGFPVVGKYFR